MDIKSCNKFCPLDMLAEVASATLQNDPSLLLNLPEQGSKINKVCKPQARKSVHSSEKLSLEQIKKLSEKSLIEMFSEPICDEMNRKYSFQCYLTPDQCSQVFKSFGNETRAKSKMKFHLLAHIRELTAAASGNREPFMAEPLHVRRKRLQEMNRKSTRKKKQTKQLSNKLKKDHCEQFPKKYKGLKALKTDAQNPGKAIENSKDNWPSRIDYDNINFGYVEYVDEMNNNNYIGSKSQYLPYPSHNPIHKSTDHTVLIGQSNVSDFNSAVPQGRVKRKPRSQNQAISKRKNSSAFKPGSIQKPNSDYLENNCHIYCDDQSELCLRIHHDHTYTSVNGKTFNDSSSGGDSKSSNKVYRDPFHPKKTSHRCLKRESPLIIPTPPFPYVYIPLLPHIALIQEVGSNVKTAGCKCKNNDITEGLDECSTNQNPASHSSTEDKCLDQAENQASSDSNILDPKIDVNASSDTYMKGAILEDGSNNEASDIKPLFSENDVKPECPENLQAVEKKLALKCIRALRTKKKDERGPLTCQICKNKSFTAQATLMYHYRSHAGIKPFSCSVCEATFTRQHSLNYHMLIHNNKSRFVCTDCGRNFRHPSHYKEHLRRHTGETPYECTDCNLR